MHQSIMTEIKKFDSEDWTAKIIAKHSIKIFEY